MLNLRALFSCLLLIAMVTPAFAQEKKLIYRFNIKEEIAEPIWRKTKMALAEADTMNADLIFINMNTYGGAVDAADSIRTAILNCRIPVFILIENNAASAGALISLACDSIFMQAGSTIGAATVVNQSGEQVPDKYQSYMRKKMRATAEEKGRDPDIAEAMVDPDKVVEGVSEKGKVVTLTVTEAIELGFCDGQFQTMEEVLEYSGISDYRVARQKLTWIDRVISWLINPAVSGVLILVIFGGIYFELQSPGLGFPIVAALIAATLFFAPLYLEGMAENWEILVFGLGIALIAVELFVIPGFGVAGIAGIGLAIAGLTLSMIGNVGFNFQPVDMSDALQALLISVFGATISVVGSIFLAVKLFETNALSHLVLKASERKEEGYIGTSTEQFSLIGEKGAAFTNLRPSGKVEINNEIYDATAESGFIEAGASIKVISYASAQIKVRQVD